MCYIILGLFFSWNFFTQVINCAFLTEPQVSSYFELIVLFKINEFSKNFYVYANFKCFSLLYIYSLGKYKLVFQIHLNVYISLNNINSTICELGEVKYRVMGGCQTENFPKKMWFYMKFQRNLNTDYGKISRLYYA